ncbi:MAG: primosomal protein N' [Deltaproteobacteria bacterium]|nr:primosomal protein N' [Deltaproteobacteria bacterium]
MKELFLNIIVPLPLKSVYVYKLPENLKDQYSFGKRVLIPFGKRKTYGYALELLSEKPNDIKNIKEILGFSEEPEIFDIHMIRFFNWISNYYHHPLGQVIKTATPQFKNFRPLKEKNIKHKPEEPLVFQEDQKKVFETISETLNKKTFKTFLIHGVTGSGKTEIYLQLIEKNLLLGKSSIVLVPEISLTPQMESRFKKRFGNKITTYHSGLSGRERYWNWRKAKEGSVSIILGTRSAIFAPFKDLGLIIIDEEHDSSFKQESGLLYNARNLALVRGQLENFPVVLGSATPSLESYYAAQKGKYTYLHLPSRINKRPLPQVKILSLQNKTELMSFELKKHIEKVLEKKEQVLLFLNRRGFSHFLLCTHCGYTAKCSHCSVTLTYHKKNNHLKCHHCNATKATFTQCPECHNEKIKDIGSGTEKIEEMIQKMFPQACVARLDRDKTNKKGVLQDTLSKMGKKEIDILIGTQMITKGHDFPDITLVGILMADSSLNLPDFRAGERTFQLITQVAGRAGRGEKPGFVYIQTFNPDLYILKHAQTHDFESFAQKELLSRESLLYPPFSRLCNIRIQGKNYEKTWECAVHIKNRLLKYKDSKKIEMRGPSPAPLSKVQGRFRFHILLKAQTTKILHQNLLLISQNLEEPSYNVQLSLDIDPLNLL